MTGRLWCFLQTVALCCLVAVGSGAPAPVAPSGGSLRSATADPPYTSLLDQAMVGLVKDASSPPFADLQPAGHARILRAVRPAGGVFMLAVFALHHPRAGCVGQITIVDFYRDNQWGRAGYSASLSCLSPHIPATVLYTYYFSGPYSMPVYYGRTQPHVRAIRLLLRGRQALAIPVRDGAFVALHSCSDVQGVEALDRGGHVVYRIGWGGRCRDRPPTM